MNGSQGGVFSVCENLKSKMKKINIPAWVFLLFSLLFDELLLHFWTLEQPSLFRFLCVLFFSLSFALFAGFFSSLGRSAVFSRVFAVVIASVYAVFLLIEYFSLDAYKVYMTPASIFAGAEGVATGFGSTVLAVVLKGFWRILLIALPVVLYAVFGHMGNWGRTRGLALRGLLAFSCLFTFCLGYFTMSLSPDTRKYDAEYNFTDAIKSFGMITGMRLELGGAGANSGGFSDHSGIDLSRHETDPAQSGDPTAPTGESVGTEPTEPPKVYGLHQCDIDFAARAETDSGDVAALDKYVASLTPTRENDYTGLFRGKNLIFITAEAFSAEVVDPERTPTLYRMATKGIQFNDYYQPAWGGSTSTGEYSNMTGLVPTNGVQSIQDTVGHNMYYTIGNMLRREDYWSAAYHNGEYDYYSRDKTHQNLGYDTWMGLGNGMENGVQKMWPESDLEMIDYTLPMYINRQPFSIYYMSISGHCLYTTTGNNMAKRNFDAMDALTDDSVSRTVVGYYAANYELEKAMDSLVKQLEAAGIADDTVIVIGTDHYPYGLEKSDTWGNDKDYLAELYGYEASDCFKRDHSRLIIWSECLENCELDLIVDEPTYSLDIVPTLANLFGLDYDSRLYVGRDVFSDDLPLALWNSYSWKTDKGSYNAATGSFTPAEGMEVSQDYINSVKAIVSDKIYFSKIALNKDYYGVLFD